MTIKQYGGVFGRNPTFNNVTIEGTLTFDGDIDINSDLTIEDNLYVLGSVGIGNTSPATALDVTGTVTADGLTVDGTSDLNGNVTIGTSLTTLLTGNDIDFQRAGDSYLSQTGGGALNIRTNDGVSNKVRLNLASNGDISFYNDAAAQALFWDSSASRLGLGTTLPASALELSGAATANARLTLSQTTAGLSSQIQQGSTGLAISAVGSQPILLDTNGVEAMRIDSSGNVRIGVGGATTITGLTQTNLIVGSGTGGEIVAYRDDNAGVEGDFVGAFLFGNDDNSGTEDHFAGMYGKIVGAAGNSMSLNFASGLGNYETDTPQMVLDASGNLLVGTAVAGDQGVTIYGGGANGLYSKTTSTSAYWITNDGLTSATGTLFAFYNNTTPTGSITITSTNVTNYNSVSDERLKENIEDSDDSGTKIDSIQVRKFDWKTGGEHQDYGFIAQELVGVAPEAVTTPEDPEEMMSVDPAKLVPMMLKEIQSLRARVAQLES
jgi:hypothetical protein